ncbi:MAG: T9SS type A sorting domain-containing protein, partial [Aquaticitalea sp.]
TSPITMSRRWLYLYENHPNNSYADWRAINENSPITVGLGFTMKGSSAPGALQNYTFVGQPNNGTITSPITANFQALLGNPYPSAIDGYEFILDNQPSGNPGSTQSIDGTLYFWEHSSTNSSHVLSAYEGGYATLNLSGGLPAVSPPEINGEGAASKIPKRFIPVSQGFYVTASPTAGTGAVQFKNTQRFFVKESSGNSDFFRMTNASNEEVEFEDTMKRVRMQFKTPEGAKRQIMIAFTDDNAATDSFDYGYDAENTDALPSDMSFMIHDKKYLIQGVGQFDRLKHYPLGVFLGSTGSVEMALTDIENFNESIDVFIYDATLDTYHSINDTSFAVQLGAGAYVNRFYLAFSEDETLATMETEFETIVVNYLQATDEIYIRTPNSIQVKQVYLINILGQTVKAWNSINTPLSNEMKIPVKDVSEGNYIIKVQTDTATHSKKIFVKL